MLLGTAYWSGLVDWIRGTVLADGNISEPDLEMFRVTDDVDEAVAVMTAAQSDRPSPAPGGGETPGDAERPD